MTKQKSIKHALLMSALAIIMCVSMLVGSTFAWFTDSVTSVGNKIQSGTLKLDLEVLDEDENWNSIKNDQTPLFNYEKWEPGYTEFKILKVVNEGSLALKWYAKFMPSQQLGELADVIDVFVCPSETTELTYPADRNLDGYTNVGTLRNFVGTIETTTHGQLDANKSAYLGIALKMQETAGNEYQDKTLGAFDIMILATQNTVEDDSFDNQYDVNAEYDKVSTADTWDGTADTSWYNENATEFKLTSAEQLAGMNELIGQGVTFEGKTVKLEADLDMSGTEWEAGYDSFSGTFDGQNHTISNLAWSRVNNKTSGRMGLFAHVENGTVKNVTLDNADFYGYGPYGGVVAGGAYGECVFENITLKNCNNEMYNTGSAGIVGLASSNSESSYTFTNISIDNTNTIGSIWGSPDTSVGALIGYFWDRGDGTQSPIIVEDSYISPVMSVYNDVVANYQWYAYRLSGMLVGYVSSTEEVDGTTYPVLDNLVCDNVTVEYGDWANYYYCEMVKNGKASYTHDYKFSRLTPISSLDEIKSGDVWTRTGNFVIIDGNNATCYHIVKDEQTGELRQYQHSEAGTQEINGEVINVEDHVCVLLTFDQLYGGNKGVYGTATHDGVTVIYNNK